MIELLMLLLLAKPAEPPIIFTEGGVIPYESCTVEEMLKAIDGLLEGAYKSTDIINEYAVYKSPAQKLREAAEAMERRDAAIEYAREIRSRCGRVLAHAR